MYNRPFTPEWITELKPNEIYRKNRPNRAIFLLIYLHISKIFCIFAAKLQLLWKRLSKTPRNQALRFM